MSAPTDKKIIIDADWKEEAQREKEALAQAMESEKKAQRRVPEKASFAMLLSGLATQALMSLGELENPFTKKSEVDLPEARFHIDMLELMQEKTKGNLTSDEDRMLQGLLYDLRMRYVEMVQSAK